ncbi:hypothetical protein SAMN05216227_10993, partial [Pseudorhodobacter antarcticus]
VLGQRDVHALRQDNRARISRHGAYSRGNGGAFQGGRFYLDRKKNTFKSDTLIGRRSTLHWREPGIRLRKEVRRLREEREVLKKAAIRWPVGKWHIHH